MKMTITEGKRRSGRHRLDFGVESISNQHRPAKGTQGCQTYFTLGSTQERIQDLVGYSFHPHPLRKRKTHQIRVNFDIYQQ